MSERSASGLGERERETVYYTTLLSNTQRERERERDRESESERDKESERERESENSPVFFLVHLLIVEHMVSVTEGPSLHILA